MGAPTEEDLQFGANRIEIYICELCGTVTRFPRYNDPAKLMETQCGRCGEWANCFTFYCVALGYDARLVLDFTDHVWTECYSPYLGRFMHLDPCEASYDKPLLYEKGWGKKLNYVIAFGMDGVYDVTKRYTRNWQEVLSRRNMVSEDEAEETLAATTAMKRSVLDPEKLDVLAQRDRVELEEFAQGTASDASLPGRQSGSEEWRQARGELGAQHTPSDRKFCPTRLCIDEHVGKIYKAIGLLSSEANRLQIIRSLLLKLKDEPFKTRKIMLTADEHDDLTQTEGAAELLDAIGLATRTENENGKVEIALKELPVKVSLALAVVVENIDRITRNGFDKSSLQLMTEGRRICGGTVCATGEEIPLIASEAFDGLYSTKWEEPDGAKGACLVYNLPGGSPRLLSGYDFVSANDCPERDPSDWVLEGSSDDGETWQVLDERAGELFEERFQRRCFRIDLKNALPCKMLRLQFNSVHDAEKSSRLQLSCIDFYATK